MAVEVCATDVIKLIVQFLQENHLSRAASVLQEEAGVEFLQLKEKHKLLEAIEAGSWTEALAVLSTLPLPPDVSAQVHEQVHHSTLSTFLNPYRYSKSCYRARNSTLQRRYCGKVKPFSNIVRKRLSGIFPSKTCSPELRPLRAIFKYFPLSRSRRKGTELRISWMPVS